MARIRSIKPEFFTSPDVTALPIPARLTFVGLWTFADDYGRAPDDTRLLKAAVWPLDDEVAPEHIEDHIERLSARGMVLRYAHRGRRYLQVINWEAHQRPTHRGKPKHPAPPAETLFPLPSPETPRNGSGDTPVLARARGTGNREQGTGNRETPNPASGGRVEDSDLRPSRAQVRSVACPSCNAGEDEPCKGRRGQEREANHQERVEFFVMSNSDRESSDRDLQRKATARAFGTKRCTWDPDAFGDEAKRHFSDEPDLQHAAWDGYRYARTVNAHA